MDIQSILLVIFLLLNLIHIFYKRRDLNLVIFSIIFSINFFKLAIEKYIPILDAFIAPLMILLFIYMVFKNLKIGKKLKIQKFMTLFLIVILVNFLFSIIIHGNVVSDNIFFSSLINILYIYLVVATLTFSRISTENFKKAILPVIYPLIFYISIGFLDYFIYRNNRIGEDLNPNYYALSLILAFVFFSYTYNRKKIFVFFTGIIVAILIFLTNSDSAIVSIAIMFFLSYFSTINFRITLKIIYIAITAGLLFTFYISFANEFDLLFVKSIFTKDDFSRIYIFNNVVSNFIKNPIFGVPYGTFRVNWNGLEMVTHNDYLRILVELGLIGFLLFISQFYFSINKLKKFNQKTKTFLISIIIINFTYSLTHNNLNNPFFWIILLLPYLLINNKENLNVKYKKT